jgi:hypothetical protein
MWAEWAAVGALIVAVAFALRIAVHAGGQPGGVDTWYYLAYADAFRARPSFKVRLPQYLLQDEVQSYPPLFPMFLSLFPRSFLLRWFWTISPAIDCVHLLLLYWLAFKITASVPVAVVSASVYAFTPQLISETRSLNGRPFGALVHSVAMLVTLRYVSFNDAWPWLPLAVGAGAVAFLASATGSTGYAFACVTLACMFRDARYVVVAAGALAFAVAASGGHYIRVLWNYFHAVAYWFRNRSLFGAHPILHSPIYGSAAFGRPAARPGFLGGSVAQELVRLFGENPFLLALPFAPAGVPPWGTRLYVWAVALAVLSVVATVLPPLRAFGPGRAYLKAGVFPTAYTLAVGIGTSRGLTFPLGQVTLMCLAVSVVAIAFFYVYTHRQTTERTASVPQGLALAVHHLANEAGDGVLCIPYSYADYTCYNSGKRVLWGGHCGSLRSIETLAPVISRRLSDLLEQYDVRYVLLDTAYAQPEQIGLVDLVELRGRFDTFDLYEFRPAMVASTTPASRST